MNKQIYPWRTIPKGRNFVPASECECTIHNFLWGFDIDQQNPCLLYRLDKKNNPTGSLPKLKGIEVFYRDKQEDAYLVFCLIDRSFEDIFYQFGRMLMHAITDKVQTKAAPRFLIARCWRWHTFLHSRSTKILTSLQQQGLIAELTELSNLLDLFGDSLDIIHSWVGPDGEKQDFNFTKSRLEVKSSRPSSSHSLRISSEDQLEVSESSPIYLCHTILEKTELKSGLLLTDLIESIVEKLQFIRPQSVIEFAEKLLLYGFSWDHDYSESRWCIISKSYYHVSTNFPLVSPSSLPHGIKDVSYSIIAADIEPYKVDQSHFTRTILN